MTPSQAETLNSMALYYLSCHDIRLIPDTYYFPRIFSPLCKIVKSVSLLLVAAVPMLQLDNTEGCPPFSFPTSHMLILRTDMIHSKHHVTEKSNTIIKN